MFFYLLHIIILLKKYLFRLKNANILGVFRKGLSYFLFILSY